MLIFYIAVLNNFRKETGIVSNFEMSEMIALILVTYFSNLTTVKLLPKINNVLHDLMWGKGDKKVGQKVPPSMSDNLSKKTKFF